MPSIDRKSTRLNSSHGSISYAVFCLKKKKKNKKTTPDSTTRYTPGVIQHTPSTALQFWCFVCGLFAFLCFFFVFFFFFFFLNKRAPPKFSPFPPPAPFPF